MSSIERLCAQIIKKKKKREEEKEKKGSFDLEATKGSANKQNQK